MPRPADPTPFPWRAEGLRVLGPNGELVAECCSPADADAIVQAAFRSGRES